MASNCENVQNCNVCLGEQGRFRCKKVTTLDTIESPNTVFRFFVEGGGGGLYSLTWGKKGDHCSYGVSLPIAAGTTFSTFLSESFMSAQSPKIPWGVMDTKHPLAFAVGVDARDTTYVSTPVQIDRVDLHVTLGSDDGRPQPILIMPMEAKLFAGTPTLRFGENETIRPTSEGFERFIKPAYSGLDSNAVRARKMYLLDVRVGFKLAEGHGATDEDRSLFDRSRFHLDSFDIPVPPIGTTSLMLHQGYKLHLMSYFPTRRRKARAPEAGQFETMANAPAKTGSRDFDRAQVRQGVFLMLQGLGLIADQLFEDEPGED